MPKKQARKTQTLSVNDEPVSDVNPDEPQRLPDVLYVRDMNARLDEQRVHSITIRVYENGEVETKEYALSSRKRVKMPASHAMQFLRDESFEVTNEKGTRLKPVEKTPEVDTRVILKPGECVAKYEELTDDALFRRCMATPGAVSEMEGDTPPDRSRMVVFLQKVDERKHGNVKRARGSEHVIDEMSVSELENVLDISGEVPA